MATAQFFLTDKLLQASERNRIVTQRRMNDFAHRYPFPEEEEAQKLGLQPTPKLRKYMVFSGVEGLRVVEELAYETIAAMSDRDSRHYWSTTMFMSDETEARSVWATNPEQAIDICQLRLSEVRVTSSELCGARSSESKYSLFT
jgi:hypothetical protein